MGSKSTIFLQSAPHNLARLDNDFPPAMATGTVQSATPSSENDGMTTTHHLGEQPAPETTEAATPSQLATHSLVVSDSHAAVAAAEFTSDDCTGGHASQRASSCVTTRRGCVRMSYSSEVISPAAAESDAAAVAGTGESDSANALPSLTAAELRAELDFRQRVMFVVGSDAPKASGRDAILPYATNEAVQIGWELIRERCKADVRELSRSFGNFDQRVGLGWLLGDAVLGGFIPGADALAIGIKAVKAGPDLKAAFAAPSRRVSKAKYSTDEARERAVAAAADEEAALRHADAELPMPAEALPPPPAAKRHCVRAAPRVPSMPPKPPPDPRVALRKQVAAADRAVQLAADGVAAAKRAVERLEARRAQAFKCVRAANRRHSSDETHAELEAEHRRLCQERVQCYETGSPLSRAEYDLHLARLAASEVRDRLKEAERDHAERERSAREERTRPSAPGTQCAARELELDEEHLAKAIAIAALRGLTETDIRRIWARMGLSCPPPEGPVGMCFW